MTSNRITDRLDSALIEVTVYQFDILKFSSDPISQRDKVTLTEIISWEVEGGEIYHLLKDSE